MTFKTIFAVTGLAVALTTCAITGASAHGMGGGTAPCGGYQMGPGYGMGPGMMGQGMMNGGQGYGMGPGMTGQGMMGQGMGYGMNPMMGSQGMMGGQGMMDRNIGAEDVRRMMEYQLNANGNPNLKLGKVEEVNDDVISAEVVTKDDSLVQRYLVNRHTGWMQPAPQQ